MDADHLDIYGTHEEMIKGYRQFISQIQPGGFLLYRHDLLPFIGKEVMAELDANDVETFSFGIDVGHYHTSNMRVENGVWHWDIQSPWGIVENLELLMPGRHNVLNATASYALVMKMGGDEISLRKAMPGFKGVSRRFDIRYQ